MRCYTYFLIIILSSMAISFSFAGGVGANVVVSNGIVSVSISPTADSLIAGNSETWTATVIPGTPPYSYTWNVYNFDGSLAATTTYSGNAYASNEYTYLFNYGQTYYANVVVVDAIPNTATSQNSVIKVCYPSCTGGGSTSLPSMPPQQQAIPNKGDFWESVAVTGLIAGILGLAAFALVRGKKGAETKQKGEV